MSAYIENLDHRFNFSDLYAKRIRFIGTYGDQARSYHEICIWLTEAFGPGCDAKTTGYIPKTPKWAYYRDREDTFYIYLNDAPLTAVLLNMERWDIKSSIYRTS